MYRVTSARACSRVGYTVRLTRSTLIAALNDSASALSKQLPVRPTERRIPNCPAAVANASEVYCLGAPVRMEDRAVGKGIVAGGHRQGVDHQLGTQMIGHRVADA